MFLNKNNDEFTFGKDDFMGDDLRWSLDRLPLGICVTGGTGSGKTNRVFLPFFIAWLRLRARQADAEKWGGVFLDPKLSFAARLIELVHRTGLEDELYVLNEHQQVTINPLLSGLSGPKIAEMLVKSLAAGKPMAMGSGAFYYETRAQALLGHLITVAQCAARPSLRLVADMVDVLTQDGAIDSAHPQAAEAVQRLEVFARSDEGEKRKVLDSLQNYLEPYRHAPWKNIFFEYGDFTLDTVRDHGKLLVAAFSPNQVNHLSSGLFLLKMLWYSVIMERLSTNFQGNRERLCLYVVDEFQQVATGSSDADFLAVRREARGCPVFAFQQLSQLKTVLPYEWENVLGLLSTKIFLRQSDLDTAMYAEKLGGFIEENADAVTKTSDSLDLFYTESSRTTTRQLHPRIPADYLLGLPDGDTIIINDRRRLAWLPAYGMTQEQEINWRKKHWPDRPRLLHPRDFRQ